MTASAIEGERQKCLAAGMNDFIPKPITPAALAEMLEKWLPMQAAITDMRNNGNVGGHGDGIRCCATACLGQRRPSVTPDGRY